MERFIKYALDQTTPPELSGKAFDLEEIIRTRKELLGGLPSKKKGVKLLIISVQRNERTI